MAKKKEPQRVGNDIYGVNSNWKLDWKTGKNTGSDIQRSNYFHKYFHGYTELRIPKPGGGYRIKRYYTEPWLVHDVKPAADVAFRALYFILTAAICLGFWMLMSSGSFDGNASLLVVIPEVPAVLSLILLLAASLNYMFMRRRMTWYDHRSSSGNLKKAAVIAAACLGATGLMVIANIFTGVSSALNELKLAGGVLICAAGALFLYLLEKNMPYREEKNDTVLPEGETHAIW